MTATSMSWMTTTPCATVCRVCSMPAAPDFCICTGISRRGPDAAAWLSDRRYPHAGDGWTRAAAAAYGTAVTLSAHRHYRSWRCSSRGPSNEGWRARFYPKTLRRECHPGKHQDRREPSSRAARDKCPGSNRQSTHGIVIASRARSAARFDGRVGEQIDSVRSGHQPADRRSPSRPRHAKNGGSKLIGTGQAGARRRAAAKLTD